MTRKQKQHKAFKTTQTGYISTATDYG